MAVHELVDVAQVLQQFPGFAEGRVTSSISDSEKSVVMCSFVNGAPSTAGCRVCTMSPRGRDAQRLFFHAFAAAAQDSAFP